MPIPVACPRCSKRLRAPDTAAGRSIACPACTAPVPIPAAGPPPVLAARARPADPEPDEDDTPGDRPRRVDRPAPRPLLASVLRSLSSITWLLLLSATVIGLAVFTLAISNAKSAPQEASIGAIFSTGFLGCYIAARCVEKLAKLAD
jgi:hypothetical protein